MGKKARAPRSRGCSVVALYNQLRTQPVLRVRFVDAYSLASFRAMVASATIFCAAR